MRKKKKTMSAIEAIRQVSDAMHGFGVAADEAAEVFWNAFCGNRMRLIIGTRVPYELPEDLKDMPNNWLKMHGYPMRRRMRPWRKNSERDSL